MSGESKSSYPSEMAQKKISEMVQRMLYLDLLTFDFTSEQVLESLSTLDWYDELLEMYSAYLHNAVDNDIPPCEEGMNSQLPRT